MRRRCCSKWPKPFAARNLEPTENARPRNAGGRFHVASRTVASVHAGERQHPVRQEDGCFDTLEPWRAKSNIERRGAGRKTAPMTNSAVGSDVDGGVRFSPPGVMRFGEAYRHVETASRLSWNPLCAQSVNPANPPPRLPGNTTAAARSRRPACSKNAGLAASMPNPEEHRGKTPDGA